jgi:DNA-binding transcriptional ArsR family regulator
VGQYRRDEILSRVQRHGYVSVKQLAEEYQVDSSTIRRDLDRMAAAGLVHRSHGGATMPGEPEETPYAVKVGKNVAQKRAIARAVAALVPDGASILMDSGSTTLEIPTKVTSGSSRSSVTSTLTVSGSEKQSTATTTSGLSDAWVPLAGADNTSANARANRVGTGNLIGTPYCACPSYRCRLRSSGGLRGEVARIQPECTCKLARHLHYVRDIRR